MIKTLSLAVALSAVAFAAPPALAAEYPPPANPGKVPAASKKGRKLVVCKRGCRYKTIRAAIKRATGRDLIVVRPGTYREGVQILGRRYDGLRIVGDPKNPRRVRLDGKGVRGAGGQNAFFVNAADGVTIRGFYARNYKANCFFVVNADGYTLDRLVAERCGVYGIYAFNSKGGTMSNSEAYYNNDSGFYIGQTPPQKGRKKRSFVTNVKSYLNVLGFSGTNMRYVTIRRSQFFNNGVGIVPNALRTEKYPPRKRTSSPTTTSSGTTSTTTAERPSRSRRADRQGCRPTRSVSASCSSEARARSSRTTASSGTGWSASAWSSSSS